MRKDYLLRGTLHGVGMAASLLFLADLFLGDVRWPALALCISTSAVLLVLNLRTEAP